MTEIDAARLRRIQAVFEQIACTDVTPLFDLTSSPISRASRGWFGRQPRIWISREAADTDPRGDVGHEYAHLLDQGLRRDTVLQATGFTVLGLAGITATIVYPLEIARDSARPLEAALAVWLTGWLALVAAVCWAAYFSYRIELRTDRIAAELFGSADPLLAMLDRFDVVRSGYGWRQRAVARLTHPSPDCRRRALTQL
jgi:hypothetical protein